MELIMQFTTGLAKGFSAELIGKIVGYGIGGTLAFWLLKKIKTIWAYLKSPFVNALKVKRARNAVSSQKGLWLSIPIQPNKINPPSCPVIMVANLKGGVGKTTLTANLTAHCASKRQEQTLCIDFDYQGSLTSMAYPDFTTNDENSPDQGATRFISNQSQPNAAFFESIHLPYQPNALAPFPRIKFIPADYPLAQAENRLMVNWLLDDLDFDIRTKLAKDFEDTPFKRIIIDAPPRLTTCSIQGLYASTHIIIPTILDRLSTQAVGRFIEQIRDLRNENLCPYLKRVTVVGTMVDLNRTTDKSEYEFLELALKRYSDLVDLVPFELSVLERAPLAKKAGHEIAYLVDSNAAEHQAIRKMFDDLGDHLWD